MLVDFPLGSVSLPGSHTPYTRGSPGSWSHKETHSRLGLALANHPAQVIHPAESSSLGG